MNNFTRRIVEQACRRHVSKAIQDADEFRWIVEEEFWLEVMDLFGWKIKERAVRLFQHLSKEDADRYDIEISDIATRSIERIIREDEELRLDDYEDYHIKFAHKLKYKQNARLPENQIELF